MHADPREAVRGVLFALRSPLGVASPSPELWTFCPSRVMTVDAAGYAHEREEQPPSELAPVAAEEPFGTLRVELLDALLSWCLVRSQLLERVLGGPTTRVPCLAPGGGVAGVDDDRGEGDPDLVLEAEGGLDQLVHRGLLWQADKHDLASGRVAQHLDDVLGLGPQGATPGGVHEP